MKTDLKNYVFLDKFKNKLTKSSESEVKIEDICDENNYIFTVQEFNPKTDTNKQLKQEEELRIKKEEELKIKEEEELRLKQEEELRIKKEEELRLKHEEELKLKQEEELKLKQEEELKIKKEEDLRLKQEAELKLKQEDELKLKQEEELKIKKEEDLRLKQEEELKLKQEEESKLKQEEEKGIIFSHEQYDKLSHFIHIQLESSIDTLEIYDISKKSKNTYKLKKLNENKYFTICPFNYTNEDELQFGIRNYKNNNAEVEFKNQNFYKSKKKGVYKVSKEKNEINIFDIFNEPELNDNKTKLLYLEKLNEFDYYKCEYRYIKKATDPIPYIDIIDKIMEIGIEHPLTKKLIYVLEGKEINIF